MTAEPRCPAKLWLLGTEDGCRLDCSYIGGQPIFDQAFADQFVEGACHLKGDWDRLRHIGALSPRDYDPKEVTMRLRWPSLLYQAKSY